ncbi:CHAT domain-containing protein [Micromonospora parva]|uniref:CHAT domain-containing protein n=1 Tax=Micromonospora parva TaxID=1464048 RepID=UPI0033DFEE50
MVSFFLSYRSGDDNVVGRLLDDALTARFGSDSVVHDDQSAAMSDAELRRRLLASTALIVVIEPAASGESVDLLWHLPGHRTIATALATSIPILAVLADDAELPPAIRAHVPLRPLLTLRHRRVRLGTARTTVQRLVDNLAANLGPEAATGGSAISLILSVEPVRWPMPPPSHRPSVAIVYSTHDGALEVADSDRPMAWRRLGLAARYATRYEVDTGVHRVVVGLRLPAKGGAEHFEAYSIVHLQVTDPAQVVRRAIRDPAVPVRDFLLDTCRPITSRYALDELFEAETALDRQLGKDTAVIDGISLHVSKVLLSLDERVRRHSREWDWADLYERTMRLEPRRSVDVLGDAISGDKIIPLEDVIRAAPPTQETSAGGAGATPTLTGPGGPARDRRRPRRRRTSSLPDATPTPQRLLVARAPTQVPAGRDLSVEVRLVTEGRSVHPDAVAARMRSLLVGDAGTPVTVTAHAPAGLHADGPLQQTVLVLPDDDPDPIRFGFGARTPGLHRVDVTAWAGGTFLGEVSLEVSVADGGAFRDGQSKTAPLGTPQARPGEVTMEVRFDGNRYTFQLRSDAALFAPVVESVTNAPNAAVENAIRELQQLAGGGSRYSTSMVREVIRSAGIQLWSELVPADVRDQFWQIGADMSAFTIVTDHDVVPWELLYPLSAERDAGFLVEQVPVVRRTYGQRRYAKVGLRNPRFVVPPKAPTGAHEEIATIRAILGAADSEPITRADELLALINSGALGATHFACHNTFSADGSFIDMDGGRFKPALLAEASIRKLLAETGPLVFINACRSAGVAPTYTKMLGWAQQFMSSGAGAFVGTLWAVRSDSSARFATAFYRSLADGATLGAAALAARVEQQDDPLDPTWLAYTVYGDPFATAAV